MTMQRYSFGTQSPDRDALGDWVRHKDVQELVAALRQIQELTARRMLPLTIEINDIASAAIIAAATKGTP